MLGNPADPLTLEAESITVRAENLATIDAITGAAALSASLSGAGTAASVAIGLSLAFNSIDADTLADVVGADLVARSGSVELRAISAGVDRKELDYDAMKQAGLTADALNALANAGKKTSYSSDEDQSWDYSTSDGVVELRKIQTGSVLGITTSRMPRVRVDALNDQGEPTGDYTIYELDDSDLLYGTVDLAELQGLSQDEIEDSGTWSVVSTDEQTVKTGYTVRVAEGHTAGGEVGRVYVFGGVEEDYTTEDGERIEGRTWRLVKTGDVVLVASNHMEESTLGPPKESGLAGKLFRYQGASQRIDLSTVELEDAPDWQALSVEEDVELWKEDYSNTDRWRLASDFANPELQPKLVEALQEAGVELPTLDEVHAAYMYRSTEGLSWDYTQEDGVQTLLKGDRVAIVLGEDAGKVYEYKGELPLDDLALDEEAIAEGGADAAADEALDGLEFDLSEEDFEDTDRWEEVKVKAYRLSKGDTVRVARGHEGGGEEDRIYRYVGVNNVLFTADEDYSDESRWQMMPVEVTVSVVEEGKRWKLVDAAGKSYTLTFNEAPAGSSAASTAVVARNSINAVSVAASAAIGISGGGTGLAFSGAGAVALNTISGSTDALLRASSASAEAGDVVIKASSDKSISATIAALSVAIAGGSGNGLGASIGIAVARNLIGQEGFGRVGEDSIATVRALVIDSDVTTGGVLDLRSDARQVINSLVVSGSAAVGIGGGNGLAASGSGVWAENQIGTRVHAGVSTATELGERPSDIEAGEVLVQATDRSSIRSFAGAASLAAAFGGSVGAALSIGVSLARNIIDGSVIASLDGATLSSGGTVLVQALSDADIQVFGLAASVALAIGGSAGVGISGAGASALNVILGDTLARVHDSAITAADDVTVDAKANNRIKATIISASIGVGAGGGAGFGASIGISLARNYVGYDPTGYTGPVNYVSGTDKPNRISHGQIVRLGAASGARANEVYKYIGDDDLEGKDDDDGNPIDLILSQDFSDTAKWEQLTNPAANRIEAFITESSVGKTADVFDSTLDLSVSALSQQTIHSTVFAGSVAASGGGAAAVAISGAGGSAVNRIGSTTRAYVANTTDRGIKVDGDIDIIALDSASISSSVFAVSVAASFGASGVSVAVSVSLSDNSILSTVEAFTDRALLFSTEGSITLDARESASIDAASTAVAVALSVSVGAAVAGGGANAYNTIDTTTRAWSGRSTEEKVVNRITGLSELYAAGDITVNALSA